MEATDKFYKNLLDNLYDGVYFVDLDRKIKYWNRSAELITGYASSEIVGKHCWDNILMHVDMEGNSLCHGLCPLLVTMREDRMQDQEVFLRHKDGHRVPVLVRASPIKDDTGNIIGAVEIFSNNSPKITLAEKVKELQELTLLDPLTELGNRRFAEVTLHTKIDELHRYGWTFGILFLDVDQFKRINDTYGHDFGDGVLRMVAKTMQHGVRASDSVSRWGGEEFIAVITHIDEARLLALANKIRILIGRSGLFSGHDLINVTVSVGATLASVNDSAEDLIGRADKLMYRGKVSGRNCVIMG